jgi:hypothetical protein
MYFTPLKSTLIGALKRFGIHREMESFLICQEANKVIEEILQSSGAEAQYIKNRVLYIKVENPIIAAELNLHKRDIISRLKQKFGEKVDEILLI